MNWLCAAWRVCLTVRFMKTNNWRWCNFLCKQTPRTKNEAKLLEHQTVKTYTLAVWETGVSRHNGDTVNGPYYTPLYTIVLSYSKVWRDDTWIRIMMSREISVSLQVCTPNGCVPPARQSRPSNSTVAALPSLCCRGIYTRPALGRLYFRFLSHN